MLPCHWRVCSRQRSLLLLVFFSLLQRDPKLPLSCYFFQGQTDAFVETFKFPLGKGKKHCDVCLLNSSIFNLPPLNISQHNLNSETLTLAGWWKEKVRRQTDPRLREDCTILNQYRERSDCFETRWSLFGLGQEAWKKGRLAPNGLGAGPTGEEEGGCLPLKNYGETETAFYHLDRVGLRKVLRGLCEEGDSS